MKVDLQLVCRNPANAKAEQLRWWTTHTAPSYQGNPKNHAGAVSLHPPRVVAQEQRQQQGEDGEVMEVDVVSGAAVGSHNTASCKGGGLLLVEGLQRAPGVEEISPYTIAFFGGSGPALPGLGEDGRVDGAGSALDPSLLGAEQGGSPHAVGPAAKGHRLLGTLAVAAEGVATFLFCQVGAHLPHFGNMDNVPQDQEWWKGAAAYAEKYGALPKQQQPQTGATVDSPWQAMQQLEGQPYGQVAGFVEEYVGMKVESEGYLALDRWLARQCGTGANYGEWLWSKELFLPMLLIAQAWLYAMLVNQLRLADEPVLTYKHMAHWMGKVTQMAVAAEQTAAAMPPGSLYMGRSRGESHWDMRSEIATCYVVF